MNKKRFSLSTYLNLVLLFMYLLLTIEAIAQNGLETVYYPSDTTGLSMNALMDVPTGGVQAASMLGNTIQLTGVEEEEIGYAISKSTVNLAEKNHVWIFYFSAPNNANSNENMDGGFAFTLHNDPEFRPESGGDRGALGIYRSNRTNGIKNAVSIEFDNINYSTAFWGDAGWRKTYDDALPQTIRTYHIAITNPQGTSENDLNIPHDALSTLSNPIWNNSNNTVRISWTLNHPGSTEAKKDNTYILKYEYFQGSSTITDTATATGFKTFTYDEMMERFKSESVYFSLSASTGNAVKTQTISMVPTYPYTANYYIWDKSGPTTNRVPGISPNPKTGDLPAGTVDIGPHPTTNEYYTEYTSIVTIPADPWGKTYDFYYEAKPQNQAYEPTYTNVSVPYNGIFNSESAVTNLGELPSNTKVTAPAVDTRVPGSKQIEITVTYPDKTKDKKTITVTVGSQPQNQTNEPLFQNVTIPYNGTFNPEDSVANLDSLPSGTTVTSTAVDSTQEGTQTVTITVKYPDSTEDTGTIIVTVEAKPPTDADKYEPTFQDITISFNGTFNPDDSVTNLSSLPSGTTVTSTSVNPMQEGAQTVTVTVKYPDASEDIGTITVTIDTQPLNQAYEPSFQNLTIPYNGIFNPGDCVTNLGLLPSGTTITSTPINPTQEGAQTVAITVKYPDDTEDTGAVTVTVAAQPQNQAYEPTFNDVIIPYNAMFNPDDSVSNLGSLPSGTTVISTPINPTQEGTQSVTITVKYPDGTEDTETITVTVRNQPQNQAYEPTFKDINISYNGTFNPEDSVTNFDSFPLNTAVTSTSVDTTVSGQHIVTITVTYPDTTTDMGTITVNVSSQPQNQIYTPTFQDITVPYGGTFNPSDSIINLTSLPQNTVVASTSVDTNVSGHHTVTITIIYPDTTTDIGTITVTVGNQPQNQVYEPTFQNVIIPYKGTFNPEDSVTNFDSLPLGTIVTSTSINSTQVGAQTVTVTVKYPDRTEDTGTITVTVSNQPHNQAYEPKFKNVTIPYGGNFIPSDSVTYFDSFPSGTTVTSTPVYSTQVGSHTITITVKYPDGTEDRGTVIVTVDSQPMNQVYKPTFQNVTIPYNGTFNPEDSVTNLTALPLNTVVTSTPVDTTVTGQHIVTITVTYSDTTTDTETITVTVQTASVSVTGIKLNKTATTLNVGGTETLFATVEPSAATNKNVSWSSDKPSIATVDNSGKVGAVAPGTAMITVTTEDSDKTATCEVTVQASDVAYFPVSDDMQPTASTSSYTRNSGSPLKMIIKRNVDDHKTFGLFRQLMIDGFPVPENNYTKAEGSLIIRLNPSWLDTLSAGLHNLSFIFEDGVTQASFTVKAKPGSFEDIAVPSNSFTFTKLWKGGMESSIEWTLYDEMDNVAHKQFDKKVVSQTEWQYQAWFGDLVIRYVVEKPIPGYQTRYQNVGVYASITDRCCNGGTIINEKIPQTGDDAQLTLWSCLALLGIAGMSLAFMAFKRRKITQ